MKRLIYFFIIFLSLTICNAQTANEKAMVFYQEAMVAFSNNEYLETLNYCQKVKDILSRTNARVELLRVKSFFALDQFDQAKEALYIFSNQPTSDNLKEEAFNYLTKIEEKEHASLQKRIASENKEKATVQQQAKKRLEEKLKAEQEQERSYHSARSGDPVAMQLFLKNYPYHPFRLQIIHLQSEKEEEIYKNAIAKDEIVLYRAYLEQFENGKYKTFINKALHNALETQAYQEARSINTSIQYEQYLAKQPNSRYVGEILLLYESTLRAEAAQAIQEKDYKKAELCYASYTKYFPNSMHIKLVEQQQLFVLKKIKRQEVINSRNSRKYFMFNYTSDNSIGILVGNLNIASKLSPYFGFNYDAKFNVFNATFSPIAIESLEDYDGDNPLKPGFVTASFGFTMKIAYPIWGYFGGGVRYQEYIDKDENDTYKLVHEKTWQFFPEFGIKTRLGKVAVLKTGVQLIRNKLAFQIGLGF